MQHISIYIVILFSITVLFTLFLFYKAAGNSLKFLVVSLAWIGAQSALSLNGFYTLSNATPPRFALLAIPPLLVIAGLLMSSRGRKFMDTLDLSTLTILHIIRIPVELCLFFAYTAKLVPQLMTFEGRNFDIVSGITAPVVWYIVFVRMAGKGKRLLLIWNIICLLLLLNIFTNALLSAPSPFQQFAFDQPNIAIQYFPLTLLPGFLVPLVLLANIAAIRQLIKR